MWRLPLSFAFNFNMRPYMMDEFISAVKRRFGERAIIQFEAGAYTRPLFSST